MYQILGRPLPDWDRGNPDECYFSSGSNSELGQVGQNFYDPPCFMDFLNSLSWHARGAVSADFRRVFRELVAKFKPNVVLLTNGVCRWFVVVVG